MVVKVRVIKRHKRAVFTLDGDFTDTTDMLASTLCIKVTAIDAMNRLTLVICGGGVQFNTDTNGWRKGRKKRLKE